MLWAAISTIVVVVAIVAGLGGWLWWLPGSLGLLGGRLWWLSISLRLLGIRLGRLLWISLLGLWPLVRFGLPGRLPAGLIHIVR